MALTTYDAMVQFLASTIECPICRDVCRNPVRPKNCAHRYCLNCFKKCFQDKQQKACATCRTPILAVTGRGYTHDELFASVAEKTPGIHGDESEEEVDLAALMQKQKQQAASLRAAAVQLRDGSSGRTTRTTAAPSRISSPDVAANDGGSAGAGAATARGAGGRTSAAGIDSGTAVRDLVSERPSSHDAVRKGKLKIGSALGKRTADEMSGMSMYESHGASKDGRSSPELDEVEFLPDDVPSPLPDLPNGAALVRDARRNTEPPRAVEIAVRSEETGREHVVIASWTSSGSDILAALMRENHADARHQLKQVLEARDGQSSAGSVDVTNVLVRDMAHHAPHLRLKLAR